MSTDLRARAVSLRQLSYLLRHSVCPTVHVHSSTYIPTHICRYTDRHVFNGLFSMTTWVSWHQRGEIDLDFNEARDDRVAVASAGSYGKSCAPHSKDHNHASTSWLNFLQVGCSSWCQTNSIQALKAINTHMSRATKSWNESEVLSLLKSGRVCSKNLLYNIRVRLHQSLQFGWHETLFYST